MPQIKPENNFIWLTTAMVGIMVTGAFSHHFPDSFTVVMLEAIGIALLLLSLLSLPSSPAWKKRLLVILALMVIAAVTSLVTKLPHGDVIYLLLLLAFLLSVARLVAGEVLLSGSVDSNKLVGAVALYLVLGMIWSVLYIMVLMSWPDALNGIEPGDWHDNLPTTTYFSFVTLTTLGYGDISPANPLAQVLVILEAVTGMFYLAIIVASLVGAIRLKKIKE